MPNCRDISCCLAAVVLASIIFAPLIARSQTAPVSQAAELTDDQIALAISHLGSDRFQERESAQQQLSTLSQRQRPALQAALLQTQENETRARLQKAIDDLDFRFAGTEPGITLHLKNATAEDVSAALGKQLEIPLHAAEDNPKRYTIDADDQPYWEVYQALLKQGDLKIDYPAQRRQLLPAAPLEWTNRQGTFLFTATTARTPAVGEPPTAIIQIRAYPDPRLNILRYSDPVIISVKDDAGNECPKITEPSQKPDALEEAVFGLAYWNSDNTVSLPKQRKIKSIKGKVIAQVGVASDEMRLTDITTHVNDTIIVGGEKVILSAAEEPAGGGIGITTVQGGGILVDYLIRDGHGRPVWMGRSRGGISSGMVAEKSAGPYTLELKVWKTTKDITMEFEFGQ